jgi:hypothetical protein
MNRLLVVKVDSKSFPAICSMHHETLYIIGIILLGKLNQHSILGRLLTFCFYRIGPFLSYWSDDEKIWSVLSHGSIFYHFGVDDENIGLGPDRLYLQPLHVCT